LFEFDSDEDQVVDPELDPNKLDSLEQSQ